MSDGATPAIAGTGLFLPAPRLRNTAVEGTDVATQKHDVQPMTDSSSGFEVQIHELSIEQPAVVAYLQSIDPGKQEIALVHAIEVGITELVARRARARAAHANPPNFPATSLRLRQLSLEFYHSFRHLCPWILSFAPGTSSLNLHPDFS